MPAQPKGSEIEEGRFFAVIAYLSFLCVISLYFKKDNKFALYHAKQGLALFVLEVASFLLSIIPLFSVILRVAGVSLFGLLSLWGIWQALSGKCLRTPVISNIADQIII